jgi:hypothetical protein
VASPRQFAGHPWSSCAYEPKRRPSDLEIQRETFFALSALIVSSFVLPFGITASDLTARFSAISRLSIDRSNGFLVR